GPEMHRLPPDPDPPGSRLPGRRGGAAPGAHLIGPLQSPKTNGKETPMTTAEEIFTMAIHLMDQQNDATGAAAGREVSVYRTRALSVLNATLPVLCPYSDTARPGGRRPPCPPLTDFSQAVPVDDALARGALPYALAAQLLAGEDEVTSLLFQTPFAVTLPALAAQ